MPVSERCVEKTACVRYSLVRIDTSGIDDRSPAAPSSSASSAPNARATTARSSGRVASSTLKPRVSASTRSRLTPPRAAAARISSARPGTETRTVSKNAAWIGSTPTAASERTRRRAPLFAWRAITRRPFGPWYTAYIEAMTARSTCAVQMLLVAFSRRMCCSRVCSERRYAGWPAASWLTPTRRPGICRSRPARTAR